VIGVYITSAVRHSPAVVECTRSLQYVVAYVIAISLKYGCCRSACPKRPSPCPVGKGTALINGNRPTRPQPTSHHQSASSVFQCRRSSSLDVVWSTARRVCSSQHSFFHDFPHVNTEHLIMSTLM